MVTAALRVYGRGSEVAQATGDPRQQLVLALIHRGGHLAHKAVIAGRRRRLHRAAEPEHLGERPVTSAILQQS